jgi:hypothetical protein
MVAGSSAVFAQAVNGSIYGQAEANSKVTVKNDNTGLTREVTVGADGGFTITSLPTGNYTVTSNTTALHARVNAGVGTAVSFTENQQLEEVVVLGTTATPIDVTSAQVSTTFSADQLDELPIAKDIINVALLTPGTTKGDSAFGNLASFGGSSVAENSYYINGFNVTNLFQNLAYTSLPFYAIGSEQVITGGYGPEYGMSTGGVINLQTKKGTNEWTGGGAVNWRPASLQGHNPQTYASDGEPFREYTLNSDQSTTTDVWVGGPLIQDKLFVFAIGEFSRDSQYRTPNTYLGGNVLDQTNRKPFGLVNVNWNINDRNVVEATWINDTDEEQTKEYFADTDANGWAVQGAYVGLNYAKHGGSTMIAKYTGTLTDNFTVSAQYGRLKSSRVNYQVAPSGAIISYNGQIGDFNQPGCPLVLSNAAWRAANGGVTPTSCYVDSSIDAINGADKRDSGRIDFEYKLNAGAAGTHTLKAGFDSDKWATFFGSSYPGGSYYRYQITGGANAVRVRHFQTGADVKVNSKGIYLKDDWQATKKLLVSVGVRSDSFDNLNGNGIAYVTQKNIIEPRVGFSFDVKGDSTQKLYASYGVYSLPVAATAAIRGASASIFTQQVFRYTAIDPITGAPTLGAPVNALAYLNNENGLPLDPGAVASQTLDPTIQNEFIVGFQQQFANDWRGGVRMTYRNLKKTIDDFCDTRPLEAYATAHGLVFDGTNTPGCFIMNPGYAMDIRADITGDGVIRNIHLDPATIGLPKAVRKYLSAEFTLEKSWSHRWYTQMSYTWSHNYGNAEGLVDSDIGQTDTGTTEAFDFPEIMQGAYGNLPNDRRHSFKGLGAWRASDEVTLTGSLLVQSGRPIICLGNNPADVNFGYLAAYYRCNGVVVPRGSQGFTPTMWNIDLGVNYSPSGFPGLSLQAKVFNVFNKHVATNLYPQGEQANVPGSGPVEPAFMSPVSYQAPRYVALTVEYKFGK